MTRLPALRLACPVAVLLLLTGCAASADETGSSATASASASTKEPTTPESSTPPAEDTSDDAEMSFPATVEAAEQEPSDDALGTITDIYTGHHDGYDRVVLTFEGPGTPGWRVDPVLEAVQDASGNPVNVAGSSFLDVYVRGTGYPTDTGIGEYAGPDPLVPDPGAGEAHAVTGVAYEGVFEGNTQVVIGLDGDARPFRVFALSSPTRVVIDIQSP